MAAAIRISRMSVVQATNKHTATIIFFHGSGDTGDNVKEWVKILNKDELTFPHIKIIYPTAPSQPYTPNAGTFSNVWFDRKAISNAVPEDKDSTDAMCHKASELIEKEVADGIPHSRIVVGGFSMGGALSFHLAYRFRRSLAGCFAMSSFLNHNSSVYQALKSVGGENAPPLLQFHGLRDEIVPIKWSEDTFNILTELGVKGEFIPLKNAFHELTRAEIQKFKEWIANVLPEET